MFVINADMKQLRSMPKENNVPIMDKKGLKFLVDYIKYNDVRSILEIGSAIGYSAINMALAGPNFTVTKIEKDRVRYLEALKNIKSFDLDKRINLILGDALNIKMEEKFDLIFIDAAKGQYTNYFKKYSDNVKDNGAIISDNIYFHGLVEQEDRIEKKGLRQLIGKIRKYMVFLKDNKEFRSEFFKVGDGLAVSIRKSDDDENIGDAK